ncbi:MAG TPA: histidine kinase dimerization/phosphoacceptor domain-containing protein [Anaerolineales bacterium]|nr:histidine kinase dimerization/phosphoacceptor domain-containing protein [Anaerolineales bacterium]
MKRVDVRGYQGAYRIGFIMIGVVAIRALISFQREPALVPFISLLALYTVHYVLEPWLSNRFPTYKSFYIPFQTIIVTVLANLRPFSDITCLLYVPLSIQILRAFTGRVLLIWIMSYVVLLTLTLMFGMGWQEGLALVLTYIAVCGFVGSYDFLYFRTQTNLSRSNQFLADLQSAHQKLQEYAAQAEELAAARERNRLARELHDSVSQAIFSITLTSQSARLLLDREPARVLEQLDRLQTMTEHALSQLRSLIAQLRPR